MGLASDGGVVAVEVADPGLAGTVGRLLRGAGIDTVADGATVRIVAAPGTDEAEAGRLVAVTGVRGGCWATTVAVGLARALQDVGSVALVDLDHPGPGIDLALGADDSEGARWPDLVHVDRGVRGGTLTARLPRCRGMTLLSQRGHEQPQAVPVVLDALRQCHDWVVVDAPRFAHGGPAAVQVHCHVLVVPEDLAGVTVARPMLHQGGRRPVVAVTSTRGPMSRHDVRAALPDVPAVEIPSSRMLVGAADFGDLADAVTKGRFARACDRLAAAAGA